MPLKAKFVTIAILWASLLISIYRTDLFWLDLTLFLVGVGVSALILKIKTASIGLSKEERSTFRSESHARDPIVER
jgi:hypothetical protein